MAMWIMKSELFTKWALFLYPIIVAFRIFCSNGFLEFAETDDEQGNEWLTPAMLGLFALSFFVIKAVPYFLAGRSHMRNVYVMGTTAFVFALGTFIRCVIQKKRRSLNKNFAGLFIGTICALILLECSTRGAGMIFTAKEPYYEAVEVKDYHKSSGGKHRFTSYYIKVRFDDGTENHFPVSKKTYR